MHYLHSLVLGGKDFHPSCFEHYHLGSLETSGELRTLHSTGLRGFHLGLPPMPCFPCTMLSLCGGGASGPQVTLEAREYLVRCSGGTADRRQSFVFH